MRKVSFLLRNTPFFAEPTVDAVKAAIDRWCESRLTASYRFKIGFRVKEDHYYNVFGTRSRRVTEEVNYVDFECKSADDAALIQLTFGGAR